MHQVSAKRPGSRWAAGAAWFTTLTGCLAMLASLAGCGSDGVAKAGVRGKVVASGQPVTAGGLLFAPAEDLKANPAMGTINPDGTFILGTSGDDDGAAIGMHTITYNCPARTGQEDWNGYGAPPPEKISPYEGLVPKQMEVEVKAGDNELTIELIPGPT